MSSPAKTYRVYCYDAVHKVVSVDLIDASTDDEAIAKAKAQGFGSRCEIWDGRRMVAQLGEEAQTA
jgi:hypothetical protein